MASRNRGWREWVRNGMAENGAVKIFRWVKENPPWSRWTSAKPGGAGVQQNDALRANSWHDLWKVDDPMPSLNWSSLSSILATPPSEPT